MSNTDGSDLVQDITKLALSDNFYTWFTTTNQIIDAINPLNIYDITARKCLNETRSGGNVIIDVETGKGIKAYPNDAIGSLTIDIENLTSENSVSNADYFLIEKPGTDPSNDLFKVVASDILPPTINNNHEFLGDIVINSLNIRDNVIRLQYGDTTTENDSGLILDTTTSSKVKFTYNTTKSAWFSNKNIGLQDGYAFLTNGTGRRAEFKYTTSGSTQYDVAIEMFMGVDSTNNDDKSWIVEARNVDRALNFIYKDYTNTDTETRIFYATVETTNPVTSTFVVTDKIQIGNVLGSTTNFKTITDYSTSIIPISNSNGILDSKWTNRYVTSTYSAGIEVGNVVKIYNDTNNQATIVKCALTSSSDETEAYSIGIVERISGGKVWVVTHGDFTLSNVPSSYPNLDPGAVYYLTNGSPNYTLTKPASGIIKPVFVATSTTGGVFFPMSAQGLSFGRFNASASGGTLISGNEVTSDAPNDLLSFVAGTGISLETQPGSNSIIIRALTAGNQPTYSSFIPNSGNTVSAISPNESLTIQGIGGIEVIGDNNTVGDILNIRGKYYRNIYCTGDSTNDDTFTLTATNYDDTLNFYAGPGINIKSYGGGLKIEATGTSVPTIAPFSISLSKLEKQVNNSILYTSGIGNLQEIKTLTATGSSLKFLLYSSGVGIQWAGNSAMTELLASLSPNASGVFDIDTAKNRSFGFILLDSSGNLVNSITKSSIPFVTDSLGTGNGAKIGLIQGDGIILEGFTDNADTEVGFDGIYPKIKISSTGGSSFKNLYISTTGETIVSDVSGNLRFVSPSGSPITFDSDTNNDTVYFNVLNDSITNSHLAPMSDNTVKVGTGSTNADNSPQDLSINSNSVLGRVGNGDLKSISASELDQILSGKYFTRVLTDSGDITPSETKDLYIKGGSGIVVSSGTNNQILITATGGGAQTGVDIIGFTTNNTSFTSKTTGITSKIYFFDKFGFNLSDIVYNSNEKRTVIAPAFNWKRVDDDFATNNTESNANNGSGLLYGKSTGTTFTTKFAQVGNTAGNSNNKSQLPFFDVVSGTGTLSYLQRATSQTDTIDRVIGFKSDGTLVSTTNFISSITISSNISNITFTNNTLDASTSAATTFPIIASSGGVYTNSSTNIGIHMPTGSSSLHLGRSTALGSTWTSVDFITQLGLGGSGFTVASGVTAPASSTIKTRYFGSSAWANLSASNSPRICMPDFLIGTGPDANTETAGSGTYLRNDSTSNNTGLIFTNYNLNTNSTKTIRKDRSCRLGLEVLDVNTGTTAYAGSKNTAYITHTYLPATAQTVDEFLIPNNSKKSYKYFIHAENSSGDFYTTELLIQVKGTTTNIIQYASSSTSTSLSVSFSVSATSGGSDTTVTLSHNNAAASLNIKLLKYEV